MAKEIVKYNNKMNQIPLKNFEKTDLDLFYTICAKIRDKNTCIMEFTFDELKESINYKITDTKRFIADLDRMNDKLLGIKHKFEDEDTLERFNLFSTFVIHKRKHTLEVAVNSKYAYMLNELAKEFTSFELHEYVSLNGIYSKALYRLLKQWKTKGITKLYGVEELKELLATPNYSPKDIMKEVINPAVEDIKKHKAFSNLWCEVVYAKKRGKPVEGYIFHFGKEDLKGQISFRSLEDFDQITNDMSESEKRQAIKIAKDIVKGEKKPKKKNSFNNFSERKYTKEQMLELERKLLNL